MDRTQRVDEEMGLLVELSCLFPVIKISKMDCFLYLLLMKAKNQPLFGKKN